MDHFKTVSLAVESEVIDCGANAEERPKDGEYA